SVREALPDGRHLARHWDERRRDRDRLRHGGRGRSRPRVAHGLVHAVPIRARPVRELLLQHTAHRPHPALHPLVRHRDAAEDRGHLPGRTFPDHHQHDGRRPEHGGRASSGREIVRRAGRADLPPRRASGLGAVHPHWVPARRRARPHRRGRRRAHRGEARRWPAHRHRGPDLPDAEDARGRDPHRGHRDAPHDHHPARREPIPILASTDQVTCDNGAQKRKGGHRDMTKTLAVLATLVAILATACGGGAGPGGASSSPTQAAAGSPSPSARACCTKVIAAYSNISADDWLSWYAFEKGIFTDNGLTVDLQSINGGAQTSAALLANSIQIGQFGGAEALSANAGGADLVLVANLAPVSPYTLYAAKGLTSS